MPTAGAIVIGSWDNTVCFYSIEYSRVLQSIDAHDDSVACIAVGGGHLLSGSWDSSVKLWQLDSDNGDIEPIAEFHELETDVRCVAIDAAVDAEVGSATMAAAGCADGTVAIFDIEGEYMIASATVSSAAMCAVAFVGEQGTETAGLVVACCDGIVALYDCDCTRITTCDMTRVDTAGRVRSPPQDWIR